MNSKKEILDLSYPELVEYCISHGNKTFNADQIFQWIYQRRGGPLRPPITSFDDMKNLPKELREQLTQDFTIGAGPCARPNTLGPCACPNETGGHGDPPLQYISNDGTIKFLFTLQDGNKIETVLIPAKKRNTVCVSTQVGCKFGCKFCASGIGGFKRNLTTAEIIGQILSVRRYTLDATRHTLPLTHVVFMGIGEPFDNYDNVLKAIRIINGNKGMNIAARRITVSTCGVIPGIRKDKNVIKSMQLRNKRARCLPCYYRGRYS